MFPRSQKYWLRMDSTAFQLQMQFLRGKFLGGVPTIGTLFAGKQVGGRLMGLSCTIVLLHVLLVRGEILYLYMSAVVQHSGTTESDSTAPWYASQLCRRELGCSLVPRSFPPPVSLPGHFHVI